MKGIEMDSTLMMRSVYDASLDNFNLAGSGDPSGDSLGLQAYPTFENQWTSIIPTVTVVDRFSSAATGAASSADTQRIEYPPTHPYSSVSYSVTDSSNSADVKSAAARPSAPIERREIDGDRHGRLRDTGKHAISTIDEILQEIRVLVPSYGATTALVRDDTLRPYTRQGPYPAPSQGSQANLNTLA